MLGLLKRIFYGTVDRAACLVHDRGRSGLDVRQFTDELREGASCLPPLPKSGGDANVDDAWLTFRRDIRRAFAHEDPREFLRWPVIRDTMFIANSATSFRDWKHLKNLNTWSRWKSTLVEDQIGHPIPFIRYGGSSGQQVHLTRHLAEFEQETGSRVDEMQMVFEFGGGYGNMCRQVHRSGFRGKYLIFDLPEFSVLQRYFLKSIGLNVLTADEWRSPQAAGILLLSDFDTLRDTLQSVSARRPSMFIATWSLTEAPQSVRDQIIPLISEFDAFLVAFLDRNVALDNHELWNGFTSRRPDVRWKKIALNRGNWALYGAIPPGVPLL